MNSFPRFLNFYKYPCFKDILGISLDFVELVAGDLIVRDFYELTYGKLDVEVIGLFNREIRKIGMRMEVDLTIVRDNIQTILRIYPRQKFLDRSGIVLDLRASLKARIDMAIAKKVSSMTSDFFPPYFNVFYVFGSLRGKQLEMLRGKVYCFLEANNFPKKVCKNQLGIGMKDMLYLKPEHFEQIRKELLVRGIQFNFYKYSTWVKALTQR